MTDEFDTDDALPDDLVSRLKSADLPQPMITSRVDREMQRLAASHFAPRRAAWRRRPAWAAVAATILITIIVVQLREPAIVDEVDLYADIDNSGRIDIADVLAAARSGGNAEGRQAKLDAFAMRIVSLGSGEDAS